jgi:KUP system potassium uptake protein
VAIACVLVTIMTAWQWGRARIAQAYYNFGVQQGKHLSWLVALREKVDEIRMTIEANLPLARALVQGRRRLVETDRAFVFLCSRPIRDVEEYVPVPMRIFLKKYGVLPAHVTFFHARQITVAEFRGVNRYEVVELGRNLVSVTATYGYMEQPDIRGALRELQARGEIHIPSERWIVEVGEEEIITHEGLAPLTWLRVQLFRLILKLSTPAHKYLGLGYDAGVTKELIPIVFSSAGVSVMLPELEITDAETSTTSHSLPTVASQPPGVVGK